MKSGAWYSYQGERIGQGRENAKKYLTEHPEIFAEVDTAVRAKCMPKDEKPAEAEQTEKESTAGKKKAAGKDE
jgi:recombination protein RecA